MDNSDILNKWWNSKNNSNSGPRGEFGENRPIRSGLVGNQISYKWNNNNLA